MTELQTQLTAIPFPKPAQVRAGLSGYMTDIEELKRFSPKDSLAAEGRIIRNAIGDHFDLHTGASRNEKAVEELQGLDIDDMCRDPNIAALTPAEILKVLAVFGAASGNLGLQAVYPLVNVDVATALGPKQPPVFVAADYLDQLLHDVGADRFFFDTLDLYSDNPQYSFYIQGLRDDFIKAKYDIPKHYGCGVVATPLSYPYDRTLSPVPLWEANKPADYKQKEGSTPVVWNCKGDVS